MEESDERKKDSLPGVIERRAKGDESLGQRGGFERRAKRDERLGQRRVEEERSKAR